MADIPTGILFVLLTTIAIVSISFYYRYYKRRALTHLVFGTIILCWAFVIYFSIMISNSTPLSGLYFRTFVTFAILCYMLLVYFARAFTGFRLIDKRTISLTIPTFAIIALVWLTPIYPDATGTDFTFESTFKIPLGLPIIELIMIFLCGTTLVFLIRMLSYSRALWNTSKALAIKTLLLGISGTGTFLIYSVEVTMWFSIEFYLHFMLVMAAMMSIAFFVPRSWFDRLLKV